MSDLERECGQGLGEECGIVGICTKDDKMLSHMLYYGMFALQHRGQESCGMAINDYKNVVCYKELGLTGDVFTKNVLASLSGYMGIGHVRYSTTGSNNRENAQPLVVRYLKGMLSIAHNGNIANALELRSELEREGVVFHTTNDTEIISCLIARERVNSHSVEEAITRVIPMLKGSFSLLVMSPKKLVAVRDPYGIRPLCYGHAADGSLVFASESCAIEALHGEFVRDLRPGEIIVAEEGKELTVIDDYCVKGDTRSAACIFEYIYFARPDSIIDCQSVYSSRKLAGAALAKLYPVDADMVIAVPDSGIIAAIGYSEQSGIPYGEGLLKNRYIGRTFIQPDQSMREESVGIKLNVLRNNVAGKRIVMVDDSIVRGTTIRNLITLLKHAGAKEVHVRICSPKFLYPCYFGTDVPSRENLAANMFTEEELRVHIGADTLGFLRIKDLHDIVPDSKLNFCHACFSGEYPFDIPENADKSIFEQQFYGIQKSKKES